MGNSKGVGIGMSREIWFRGKMGKGDWIYGCYVLTPDDGPVIMTCADWGGKFSHPVILSTVGQFTGLCDKNGVKIFEGDILRDGLGDDGIVTYFESIASFKFRVGNEVWNLNEGDPNRPTQLQYTEVIGNIHDNPELLKEESK